MSTIKKSMITYCILAVLLSGCAAVDLIPVNPMPDIGSNGYCRINDEGQLMVTVKNQGNMAANGFDVTIEFSSVTTGAQPSIQGIDLQAGESKDLLFDVPDSCWRPDCSFTIIIDPANLIKEGNEENNIAVGICIG